MGWWQISADTLAGSRFVISELAETLACLHLLHDGTASNPAERSWLDAHLTAYRRRLGADPVTAALVTAAIGRRTHWIADFLAPTPVGGQTFEQELEVIRSTRPSQTRDDLRVSVGGPLPPELLRDDLAERAADLLTWINAAAVRPYWTRRSRILEADILARTSGLGQRGWSAAFDTMRPGMRWLGDGRLQINAHDFPPREITDATLLFVPVSPRRGWVSWTTGISSDSSVPSETSSVSQIALDSGTFSGSQTVLERYAVIYPCDGVLADPGSHPPPDALARLLGPARAAVLRLLDTPVSTTHLVALTGQRLGSVGRHLKILLDAGLVARRRSGRSVLYQRTQAGDILVSAAGPLESDHD